MPDTLVYGRVVHPPVVDRIIPNDQTSAWDDLGPRVPYGCCRHSMLGTLKGTDLYFRDGGPSPTHRASGLTDFGVGGTVDGSLDGVIYQWNDPLGRRSGWASGGSDGLEGDGVAFVRTLGVNAINRNLVSIERSDGGNQSAPVSEKQFESICQLEAYYADQAKIPYYSFPVNPQFGIVTDMEHFEFAVKACPFAAMRGKTTEFQTRIKEILRDAQVVIQPAPVPQPVPTPPEWPNNWTQVQLAKQFGRVNRIEIDMKTNGINENTFLGFDPKGVISNMWVARAVAENITDVTRIPKPSTIINTRARDGTGSSTFLVPRSGYPDWLAFRGDSNASWVWRS